MFVLLRTFLLTFLIAIPAWSVAGQAAETDAAVAEARMRSLDPRPEAHMTFAEVTRRAEAGELGAQAELGARYGQGIYGAPQDIPKAIALLSAAAAKGNPDAQFFLASAYASGTGVPQNELQAFTLYEQAASQGHAGANYMLATMIIYGKAGISPSWSGGISNLWAAAVKDYPPAMILLGAAYQDGKGVTLNPQAAAYWYRRYLSMVQDPRAIYNLRIMINDGTVPYEDGDPGDPPQTKQATALQTTRKPTP